jgi:hypothetical protein
MQETQVLTLTERNTVNDPNERNLQYFENASMKGVGQLER